MIRPVHPHVAREKEFPHQPFELPTKAMSRACDKWVGHVLRARVVAASLVRSGKHTAGVAQPREVLRESEGPRAADGVLWWKVVGEDQDYVLGSHGSWHVQRTDAVVFRRSIIS